MHSENHYPEGFPLLATLYFYYIHIYPLNRCMAHHFLFLSYSENVLVISSLKASLNIVPSKIFHIKRFSLSSFIPND